VILALIVWSLADGVFPSQNPGLSRGVHLAMAIVAALLFFASLLLHELGHAWRARALLAVVLGPASILRSAET
jgi:hypothetical protein